MVLSTRDDAVRGLTRHIMRSGVDHLLREDDRVASRSAVRRLMSALIPADEQGDRLDDAELIAMCVCCSSRPQTTTHLIGNAVLALTRMAEGVRAVAR